MSFLERLFSGFANAAPAESTVRATSAFPVGASSPELRVEAGVATDPGCVRAVNEDALRVIRPTTPEGVAQFGVLAVVCDGMGGHEAGEIASHLALETIVKRLERDDRDPPVALMRAVQAANRAIFDAAQANPKLRGMGTTCCALLLRGGAAYSAHVGDSRLYLIRGGQIFLMTEDHSVVMELVRQGAITREEARSHPDKNVISRALGSHKEVEVSASTQPFSVRPNDAFLICSDGLYDLVSDDELLREVGDLHSQVACDRLISLARERGGHDNISVAVLRVRDETVRSPSPRETRTIETSP